MGLFFFNDRNCFLSDPKHFSPEKIAAFLSEKGIAVSDTARRIVRGRGDASDQHLQIIEAIDLDKTLAQLPACRAIAATGGKSLETLLPLTGAMAPALGGFSEFSYAGRPMRLYRMPSTSRAYPRPLEEKAAAYGKMFSELEIF